MVYCVLLLAHLNHYETYLLALCSYWYKEVICLGHPYVCLLNCDVYPNRPHSCVVKGVVELLVFKPFLGLQAKWTFAVVYTGEVLEFSPLGCQWAADSQVVEEAHEVRDFHYEYTVIGVVPLVNKSLVESLVLESIGIHAVFGVEGVFNVFRPEAGVVVGARSIPFF